MYLQPAPSPDNHQRHANGFQATGQWGLQSGIQERIRLVDSHGTNRQQRRTLAAHP